MDLSSDFTRASGHVNHLKPCGSGPPDATHGDPIRATHGDLVEAGGAKTSEGGGVTVFEVSNLTSNPWGVTATDVVPLLQRPGRLPAE